MTNWYTHLVQAHYGADVLCRYYLSFCFLETNLQTCNVEIAFDSCFYKTIRFLHSLVIEPRARGISKFEPSDIINPL